MSIDYLLSHEIKYGDIDEFIDKLKESIINNKFDINIEDIRLGCSKYPNNFKLLLRSSEYLYVAYVEKQDNQYLELALTYIQKAIFLYTPELSKMISLNDLHIIILEILIMQEKYDLAKEYIEMNNVYGCDVLLAKCDLYLKNFDSALKRSSEIYVKATSDIMNVSIIEIRILLMNKKISEAYDLIKWSISFMESIAIDKNLVDNILFPFIYYKATCERLLNISSEESIKKMKDNLLNSLKYQVVSQTISLKHFFGKNDSSIFIDTKIENIFKEIIKRTSKKEMHYKTLIDIYYEIFGEEYYE